HGRGGRSAARVRRRRPITAVLRGQEAIAHTLAYDATIMGDYRLSADEFADVKTPTLVLVGGASFPWLAVSAQQLADALPNARRDTIEGQQHNVDANVLAPVLAEFFGSA